MDTEKIVVTLHDVNYIPAYKEAEETRQANESERQTAESIRELNEMTRETNEANRKLNEDQRKAYYEEIQQKVENGEFHGENSVYVGEEEPKEDYWEVWIDPSGNPEVEAKNIYFTDNKTLQQKLDSGELNGKDGTSVTILGSYSTEEELKTAHPTGNLGDSYLIEGDLYVWNVSINDWTNVGTIQGPQGIRGPQGPKGEQGPKGDVPIKGVDYFTDEDISSLNSTLNFVNSDVTGELNNLKTTEKSNLVGAINEVNNKTRFASVKISTTFSPTTLNYISVPFNKIVSMDEGLELTSDGGIKIISPNIKKVHIVGGVWYENVQTQYVRITKNSTTLTEVHFPSGYNPIIQVNAITPVQQNDVIDLRIYSDGGETKISASEGRSGYLTVLGL